MSRTADHPARRSLLDQHLRLLGYEPGASPGDAVDPREAEEAQRVATLDLPPLRLGDAPKSARRPFFTAAPALALAATLALAVLAWWRLLPDPSGSERIRSKGTSKVWVFWERGGVVSPWSSDVQLRNGDRVRTEVLAGEPAVAFAAVTARDGTLLGSPEESWSERLELSPGERKTFAGSLKLVGEDEGERLVIIVCGGGDAEALRQAFNEALPGRGRGVSLESLPDRCGVEEFPLR